MRLLPIAFLLACAPAPILLGGGDDIEPVTDAGGTEDIDTADDTGGDETGDTADTDVVDSWPGSCSSLYDPDVMQTFELTFTDPEWRGVMSDCQSGIQNYRPMELSWNGETVAAEARLKGNWSWSCSKPQFVISFNEVDPDGRFHGLRKLMLDAPWYDRTILHERLAFPLFQKRGLPYSCANSARLVVNGEYLGLYTNIERIDHEYLERHFEDPEGNLYQGGAELKTNEDVGDISDLVFLQSAGTVEEIEALVDLNQAIAEWATEAMVPAMDNYWAGVEINYYLYDHPTRGFVYLPYDLDLSFGDSAYSDGSLVWPDTLRSDPITYEHNGWRKEPLFMTVLADRAWCERYVDEVALARAAFDPEEMAEQLRVWDEQIADAVAEDPNKPFSTRDHEGAVADLRRFLSDRAEFVDEWLAEGGHCPARW
ncbi:MAG: hypothetical protein EXR71_19445 [Myxococcales bacterium]|nr:hypothetical protein [Myxococcales bacterium]